MAPAPALPELIATVEADTEGLEPLAHLASASAIAAELTESADALIGHFVDRCRAAGRTWSEISVALGVTKQAAHKRYSAVPPNPNLMGRFTDRARQTISEAFLAARELGHPFVGTEHVLLGLFPPGGIAATLLAESGLTKAKVTEQVLAHVPRGVATDAGDPAPPYTPRAAQVFSTRAERGPHDGAQLHRHGAPRAGAVPRPRGPGRQDPHRARARPTPSTRRRSSRSSSASRKA